MIEPSSESKLQKGIESILISQAAIAESIQLIQQQLVQPGKRYVYGIQGLADLCHCSKLTA